MSGACDLLADCGRLLRQQGVADPIIARVIVELRRCYGGDRHYIQRHDRAGRQEAIVSDLASGLKPAQIARSRNCSPKTVRRIKSEWIL